MKIDLKLFISCEDKENYKLISNKLLENRQMIFVFDQKVFSPLNLFDSPEEGILTVLNNINNIDNYLWSSCEKSLYICVYPGPLGGLKDIIVPEYALLCLKNLNLELNITIMG